MVGLLRRGDAVEVLVDQFLRLLELPGEDEVADLAEIPVCFGIVVVVGAAGPEGAFIQGDPLLRDPAEDHGPHDAVAKGQAFEPFLARLPVPQHHLTARLRGLRFRRSH